MEYLLFTDTHLDDQTDNEYRWDVFRHVHKVLDRGSIEKVFCLGDFVDRKDRFTGAFVNRLVEEMRLLGERRPTWIMKGNHDDPLKGPAFFEFTNELRDVHYVTQPHSVWDVLLLPFTPRPMEDWAGLDFSKFKAAFLHVTPNGAISENGFELPGGRLPIFPRSLKLYTGDVHVPQKIGQFTVVGCPHPIKYGDKFPPRMLLLDAETLEVVEEIPIQTTRKHMLEVSSVEQLRQVAVSAGDKVKVRLSLPASQVDAWGAAESEIAAWAAENGVELAGTEVSVDVPATRDLDVDADPETLLRQWAEQDGVSGEMLELGLDLLRE